MSCEAGKLVDEVTNGVPGGLTDKCVERYGFESSSHHFGDGRHRGRDGGHDALGGGTGSTAFTTTAAAAGVSGASRAFISAGASRAAVAGVLVAASGGAKVDTAGAGLTDALGSVGGAAADVAALVVDGGSFDSKISCVKDIVAAVDDQYAEELSEEFNVINK